jgi:hypothetical protein
MRLAEVSSRLNEVSERYQVPERLSAASKKAYEGMGVASEAARRGAHAAYQMAREYPRASIGGAILAAALIGGLLWYMFGDRQRPVQRRRHATRVRAGSERRRKSRAARAAAA